MAKTQPSSAQLNKEIRQTQDLMEEAQDGMGLSDLLVFGSLPPIMGITGAVAGMLGAGGLVEIAEKIGVFQSIAPAAGGAAMLAGSAIGAIGGFVATHRAIASKMSNGKRRPFYLLPFYMWRQQRKVDRLFEARNLAYKREDELAQNAGDKEIDTADVRTPLSPILSDMKHGVPSLAPMPTLVQVPAAKGNDARVAPVISN